MLFSNRVLAVGAVALLTACATGNDATSDTEDELRRRGDARAPEPDPDSNATRIAASEDHTCVIRAGALFCWGANASGQLGTGTTNAVPRPLRIGDAKWNDFATASTHSCGVQTDGSLWCWGGADRLVPTRVGADSDWRTVSVATDRSCALKSSGSRWCWEEGSPRAEPARVERDADWKALAVAADHVCGVRTSGALSCWGSNNFNQLGVSGDRQEARVSGTWSSVSTGGPQMYGYTCAIQGDQSLWCWGYEVGGRLGRPEGSSGERARVGSSRWASVVAGRPNRGSYSAHTCGIRVDGSLHCWGWNVDHQVAPSDMGIVDRPSRVGEDANWATIGLGDAHTCAGKRDGTIWCWGSNASGQLGLDGDARSTPTQVSLPEN